MRRGLGESGSSGVSETGGEQRERLDDDDDDADADTDADADADLFFAFLPPSPLQLRRLPSSQQPAAPEGGVPGLLQGRDDVERVEGPGEGVVGRGGKTGF